MPKFTDQEKDDLILAYIDNELTKEEALEIKKYIESNVDAKNKYERFKSTKTFFTQAFEPFHDQKLDSTIKNKIQNYRIENKKTTNNYFSDFLIKIKNSFSFPNFAAGGAIAGFIGYLFLSSVPTLTNVATMNATFDLNNQEMQRIEEIIKDKTVNVALLKNEIETVITDKYKAVMERNIKTRGSKSTDNIINLGDTIIEINRVDDCLLIKILFNENYSTNSICKTENNEWKFKE